MRWHTTLAFVVAGLILVVLTGCPSMGLAPVHDEESIKEMANATSPAEAAARVAVDEADVNLSAAYRTIKSNSDNRLWKKSTAKKFLARVDAVNKDYVDPAFKLLTSRNWSDAETKASAARELLIVIQRELIQYTQSKGGGS